MSENTNTQNAESSKEHKINFTVKRPTFEYGGLTPDSEWTVKVDNGQAVVVNNKPYTRITFSHLVDQRELGKKGRAVRKDGTIISKIVTFDAWLHINEAADEIDVKIGRFQPESAGGNVGKFVWYKRDSQQDHLLHAMPSNQRRLACVEAYYTTHPIYDPIVDESGEKIDATPRVTDANEVLKLSDFRKRNSTTPAESPENKKTGKK